MKAEYLNPFVIAAVDVLEQFVPDIEIERGDLDYISEPTQTLGTMTLIGLLGDLEGRVIYNMDRASAVSIAEAMNEEDFPGVNQMVRSSIQELCNIISGNAARELQQATGDMSVDLTPPSMIEGETTEVTDKIPGGLIEVPLHTNYGDVIINVSVMEA